MFAQSSETDVGEFGASVGGSFGPGSHVSVAGSSAFSFSRHGMGLLEASFVPLGSDTLRKNGPSGVRDSQLYDFNFGLNIRVPVRDQWAPYGILAGGLLYNKYYVPAGVQGAYTRQDEFRFGFHTGGGVRYYLGHNWGIKPEFRITVSTRTYTRLTVGIFYNP
jgi:hypothetical protein